MTIQPYDSVYTRYGKIRKIIGLKIAVSGLSDVAEIGGRVVVYKASEEVSGEVIALDQDFVIIMPYSDAVGMMEGMRVAYIGGGLKIAPCKEWAGRVINGSAIPVDNKGPLKAGLNFYAIKNRPPSAYERRLVEKPLDLGIKAMNMFTTMCHGQRVGIFAGSGVGKTVLLSQLTQYSSVDYVVMGLIGERGREVGEFLHHTLTDEMKRKSILVVETSDSPALLRRQAAYITLTIAEALRDEGFNVLCMIDSLTRFAFAHREIGLSAGEIPTSKGYPPSVINEIASLLERAGPGINKQGDITGIFTVLVEGDDLQDPIADTVRSILDGHIVLDRKLAEKNQYPAINVLKSISRTVPHCQNEKHQTLFKKAKSLLATYDSMEDMIMLGAYKKGANKEVDMAIEKNAKLVEFLKQEPNERFSIDQAIEQMEEILN
jgi:flagellum-specific ATP synthase